MTLKISVKNKTGEPIMVGKTSLPPGSQKQMEIQFPSKEFFEKIAQVSATRGIEMTLVP